MISLSLDIVKKLIVTYAGGICIIGEVHTNEGKFFLYNMFSKFKC